MTTTTKTMSRLMTMLMMTAMKNLLMTVMTVLKLLLMTMMMAVKFYRKSRAGSLLLAGLFPTTRGNI